MSSITTAVAADYRLQQWVQLVKECQNRPFDMTVEQWCDTKGISQSNYYYRLRCIQASTPIAVAMWLFPAPFLP